MPTNKKVTDYPIATRQDIGNTAHPWRNTAELQEAFMGMLQALEKNPSIKLVSTASAITATTDTAATSTATSTAGVKRKYQCSPTNTPAPAAATLSTISAMPALALASVSTTHTTGKADTASVVTPMEPTMEEVVEEKNDDDDDVPHNMMLIDPPSAEVVVACPNLKRLLENKRTRTPASNQSITDKNKIALLQAMNSVANAKGKWKANGGWTSVSTIMVTTAGWDADKCKSVWEMIDHNPNSRWKSRKGSVGTKIEE